MASSSYLSGLLNATASRYSSLRRTLLSEETDGDTEDDTHISRALRAYYTEKGRPFPPWLPPDPKAPPPGAGASAGTAGGRLGFVSSLGAGMWGNSATNSTQSSPMGQEPYKGGGGLSDLWDSGASPASQPSPASLRRGGNPRLNARTDPPDPRRPSQGGFVDSYSQNPSPQSSSSRPLPSQRFGSYQSSPPGGRAEPPATGGTSAQQRLKARLYGGRSESPTGASAGSGGSGAYGNQPYERPNSTMSEDRGQRKYGSVSSEPGYGASKSPYDAPQGNQYAAPPAGGLPSGPRSGRERIGLPGGPRPLR